MYCSACGNPLSAGLSFCNRCGTSLKERTQSKTGSITAFLIAITLIGITGLGIMLGGALAMRDGNLGEDIIGFFMLFTFLTVTITEILLVRQLSRLTGQQTQTILLPQQTEIRNDVPVPVRTLAEPVASVTENTTRTLEYARKEPIKQQ